MKNLLLENVEYKITKTSFGIWRRFAHPNGWFFEEFISYKKIWGLPLVHFTRGRNPETGRRVIAKGIIAIGRLACGILAIGQASAGVLAIGQLAIGLLFGLGQLSTGLFSIGQFAIGVIFGIGQIATGYVSIGQFGLGKYVLAQRGIGHYVWDTKSKSKIAKDFFKSLIP